MGKKKKKLKRQLLVGGTMMEVTFIPKKRKNVKEDDKKEQPIGPRISKGIIMKMGRHFCGCEGNLHLVITNCIFCGKIVCEQEGIGECFFCKKEVKLEKEIQKDKIIKNRDKMINIDRNKTSTYIVDDQMDYFDSNVWIDDETRKKKQKKIRKYEKSKKNITDEESYEKYENLQKELKENVCGFSESSFKRDEDRKNFTPMNENIIGNFSKKKRKLKIKIEDEKRVQNDYFDGEEELI